MKLVLPHGRGEKRLALMKTFAEQLLEIQNQIGFKVSSRGWCYQLEGFGLIDKGRFSRVESLINKCRKGGLLPIDFVAEEEARRFTGVEHPEVREPKEFLSALIESLMRCEDYYGLDYWEGEGYYIQMLVEKIDLKTLFEPVCREYHIPIATSKGWSSILQRADMVWRFKESEARGMKPIILYCGDFDPFGLAISEFLHKNIWDIRRGTGWSSANLIIDRFGLNYNFIVENNLTWIDNLISGSGKPPDYSNPIVAKYIKRYGERKVEANAIVVRPKQARDLCREAIEKYLGKEALQRFKSKKGEINKEFDKLREDTGVQDVLEEALETLKE